LSDGVTPRMLDTAKLQAALLADGAYLGPRVRQPPSTVPEG
jgi:hypothetical protein